MKYVVGQEVWLKFPYNPARVAKVTKVGRKWVTIDDAYRVLQGAATIADLDVRIFCSRAEIDSYQSLWNEWCSFRKNLPIRPPASLTLEALQQVQKLLG